MGSLANGALVLGVILGPGYLFVRVVGRDIPIRSQTELEDLVQMLIVGVLVGLLSGLALYGIHGVYTDVDLFRLFGSEAEDYLSLDTGWAIVAIALYLFFSYLAAYGAAIAFRHNRLIQMQKPGKRTSDGSVLYGLMVGEAGNIVSVSTNFGRTFVGEVVAFTRTSKSDRELALGGKYLYYMDEKGSQRKTPLNGTVLLRESQIEYIFLFDQVGPGPSSSLDQPASAS